MEATRTIDPLAMPKGLTLNERLWWSATANRATSAKREANMLHREAIQAQVLAETARTDFGRLRQEYRARHHRKPQWAVDIMFQGLAVARDCMTDDAWYSRQASEKFAGANAAYKRAVMLMDELEQFLQHRRRPIPHQREAS